MKCFQPNMRTKTQVDNVVLTAGVSALRVAVRPSTVLRIINTHATQAAYINFGDGSETAVNTDLYIPPSGAGVMDERYVRVPNNCTSMSYLGAGATTVVGVCFGEIIG